MKAWYMATMYGAHLGYEAGIDKQQLSLFRLKHELTAAKNDAGDRYWYWLRDVVSSANFAYVGSDGNASSNGASNAGGVRPAFLIV